MYSSKKRSPGIHGTLPQYAGGHWGDTETFLQRAGRHWDDTEAFLQIASGIKVIPGPSCRLQRVLR